MVVSLSLDLGVAIDKHACGEEQVALFPIQEAVEYPGSISEGLEVLLLHPPFALVGVSALRPAPDGLEDRTGTSFSRSCMSSLS